eukprot:GDKK01033331.1.p1 GENE.GDKK01033331.1~~GDKK01033331.1.p1  ORF type:complete len:553 (+),score=89.91 GDKK01033331.1:22-1680(+)
MKWLTPLFLGSPIIAEYAVVLDAGSTGTRAHIFEFDWNKSLCGGEGATQIRVPELNLKVKPGISTIDPSPESIKKYLAELHTFLNKKIPDVDKTSTPIFFRATAGVRSLDKKSSSLLMRNIWNELKSWSEYVVDRSSVRIMSGKEEGVYGWFFLNQILGNFPENMQMVYLPRNTTKNSHENRAALFEVGGASAQVVVQTGESLLTEESADLDVATTVFNWDKSKLSVMEDDATSPLSNHASAISSQSVMDKALKAMSKGPTRQLIVCGRRFEIFSWSFNGFGRQHALAKLLRRHQSMADQLEHFARSKAFEKGDEEFDYDLVPPSESVDNPVESCIANGDHVEVVSSDGTTKKVKGSGDYFQCVEDVTERVLGKSAISPGLTAFLFKDKNKNAQDRQHKKDEILNYIVHQKLKSSDLYCVENCHYYNKEIINSQGRTRISPRIFRETYEKLCPLSIKQMTSFVHESADAEKMESACFGLILHYLMMRGNVLGLDEDFEMNVTNEVNGVGLSWVAAVVMLDLPVLKQKISESYSEQNVKNVSIFPIDSQHDEL